MLKKAVQQGCSERRGEEVQTALRVGRSPFEWFLANGKTPPVLPTSGNFFWYVEPLSDARTPLAEFFSILLDRTARSSPSPERPLPLPIPLHMRGDESSNCLGAESLGGLEALHRLRPLL